MTTQRKAAAPGDHNTVTHEAAPTGTGPEVSEAASHTRKASRVTLAVRRGSVVRFDLSAHNLPDVTTEGTSYTSDEADLVKTLAMKCGVSLHEVKKED
jgi:hypothetical protein